MPGLLAILSHPDDESMGTGGLLLRHARAGVQVHLLCTTRGGAGWTGKPAGAQPHQLPEIRAGELTAAAAALGLAGVELWDYPDGDLQNCDLGEVTARIASEIDRRAPDVVVGWGPDGGYGHPDHIATGRCTDEAVAGLAQARRPALYHLAIDAALADFYREVTRLAGATSVLPLRVVEPDIVLELSEDEIRGKVKAIDCHQSQLEDWRVAIRERPDLLQSGYGREPYVAVGRTASALTDHGLLGEFA